MPPENDAPHEQPPEGLDAGEITTPTTTEPMPLVANGVHDAGAPTPPPPPPDASQPPAQDAPADGAGTTVPPQRLTTEPTPLLAQDAPAADGAGTTVPPQPLTTEPTPLLAQETPAADGAGTTVPPQPLTREPSSLLVQDAPAQASGSPPGASSPPWSPGLLGQETSVPGGEDGSAPPPPASRIARFRAWRFAPIFEVLGTIAIALALAESVQAAVVKPFVIPSQSMEPTLMPGQRVLVNRLAYDFGGKPARGDIVVFHPPSSLVCRVNVPATEACPVAGHARSSQYFVKRVIGLPGDHLWIQNGHPVINGKELKHEPYITPCADSTSCDMPHVITVPRGDYYMLGDNRGDSDDSRYWGPVPASWIIGEVFATYWPPDRIGIF